MFFHIILTGECNSECRYCYGEAMEDTDESLPGFDIDYSLPRKIGYSVDTLADFCSKDDNCTLTFYGGEPLLCIDQIKAIMDRVKVKHFMIQTNGLLLDKLGLDYVNRFHTILVSIDGNEGLTDYYRGRGTFKKLTANLNHIVANGFDGELIARMTVMEQTDIYRQVTWLLDNSDFSFKSVHWQLNAGFWKNDFERRDFRRWVEKDYNPGIKRLVQFWVERTEKDGVVLKLYPFVGIVNSILNGEENCSLRCGGGWINYAIQTDGNIVVCPTMWGIRNYYLGHIGSSDPLKLPKVFVKQPCTDCKVFGLCGGRCLYANITKRWGSEAYGLVCGSVENLIQALGDVTPRIRTLIKKGNLSLEGFRFMKYNGCEIIP
jgi:uncharacterized protein